MLVVWVLPLFSAEPLLVPIYREVSSYVAPYFPILLFVPAVLIDLLYPKIKLLNIFLKSIIISVVFCVLLFVVQWNFSIFLLSDYAKNWFFATGNNIPYFIPIGPWEGKFFEYDLSPYGHIIPLKKNEFYKF